MEQDFFSDGIFVPIFFSDGIFVPICMVYL